MAGYRAIRSDHSPTVIFEELRGWVRIHSRSFVIFTGIGIGLSSPVYAVDRTETEVKGTIRQFISALYGIGPKPRKGEGSKKFSIEGCPQISKRQLASLLVLGQPISYSVHFEKDCDVQGELKLSRQPFTFDLELRHARDFTRLKGIASNEISTEFMLRALRVILRVKEGGLFRTKDREPIVFVSEYEALFGYRAELKKNVGGTVHVTRFRGKPVDVTDHFMIE